VALLGNGNDSFTWNPGEGSDVVEGQAGADRLVFNGSNVGENIDISANGQRVRLFRDVGAVTMDLDGVENIQLNAVGGADNIVVNDLTGTDLKQIAIDLSAPVGSAQGDGQPDTVTVNGTAGGDYVNVASSGASVIVNGLPAKVTIDGAEPGNDTLVVNGLAGNDTINASALDAGQIKLTINGGDGDDKITGSKGNDLINGGRGNDTASLGAGDDTFVWNPGDGSDTVDGQAGSDTLLFNGSNANENIDISANGGRAKLVRDVGAVAMDLDHMETIDLHALGGADAITVNDLTATDVSKVKIDLAGSTGGGDGQIDTIVINATNGDDAITITNNNGVVTVSGLASEVTISNFEANDRIVINGLGGDDVIEASGLTGMLLTANGGDGDDVLIGSAGNDVLHGDAGDDVLIGGPGLDVLDGGTGDNIVIQSATVAGANSNNVGDTSMLGDGAHAASLALLGQYMASSFVTAGDGHGATPIADPTSSQQPPLLTQPHV
jgi:Ca2+-binding RTX toxin-like protein